MNRWIRWSAVLAVAVVAGIAGWISYEHAYHVVSANGELGMVAQFYPGTVDGLIYVASMVLLDAARRRVPAPPLAYWLLALGIGATLFSNIVSGLAYGPLGAVVAAWPALALVGSYELLMLIVRAGSTPAAVSQEQNEANVVQPLIKDRFDAARVAYERSVIGGNPFSANALVQRFGVSRQEASEIVSPPNGHKEGVAA